MKQEKEQAVEKNETKMEDKKSHNKMIAFQLMDLLKKIDSIDPFAQQWLPEDRANAKIWLMNNFKQNQMINQLLLNQKYTSQEQESNSHPIIKKLINLFESFNSKQQSDDSSSFNVDRNSSGSLSSSHQDVDKQKEDLKDEQNQMQAQKNEKN